MNVYAVVILVALLGEHLLNAVADVLNLRAAGTDLPAEFADVYDRERYAQSQVYLRVTTRFGWLVSTTELAAVLGFWFAHGFSFLDGLLRAHIGSGLLQGLLFIAILMFLRYLLDLPFTLYSTFGIEARFGFNRTTWRTFLLDQAKMLAITVALGGALVTGILFFFTLAGPFAWAYCWLFATVFILVVQFVAPRWIMPLFNRFTPLAEGELRDAVLAYTQKVGFPLRGLFVIDGSRRSTKANAFFTGFGRTKRIALYDTLIEAHTVAELVGILAHEVGHYRKRHILQGMLLSIAHLGCLFFVMSLFLNHGPLFAAFYVDQPSVHAGLVFFGMLFAPIQLVLAIAIHALSRHNEYEADQFAVATTGDGPALISALKTLSREHLDNLTPHPFYAFLHYSHPPLLQRVRAIRSRSS